MLLKVGDLAPDFTAGAQDGRNVALRELRGKKVVLYFYPKAFTPLCTRETIRFRDNYDDLRALGAEVIGISVDDVDTQCRFAERTDVRFPILADATKEISRSYGVLRSLLPFDRRVTFIVDEQGCVAAVFQHEFQVSRHLDDVMWFLRRRATAPSGSPSR
jgi:peroxiredoxin Q/BCP